eukprot:TRINITY_DN3849_c0_g2_i1.p1 TRINITY_DN3849_c0_g2~~TRINITY_DN3849_c0_g2_i1.p1  ORF type:complete len:481 (+),score=157.86 TRINITY_DN3849_c0_g2_i1:80-1522(+)
MSAHTVGTSSMDSHAVSSTDVTDISSPTASTVSEVPAEGSLLPPAFVSSDSEEGVDAPAAAAGRTGALRLYTHNVFFLPTIARAATCGANPITTFQKDLVRAEWLGDYLVKEGHDILCLQEMFRAAPRNIVARKLEAAGYNVIAKFNDPLAFITNSGLFFASKSRIIHSDFRMYREADTSTADMLSRKGVAMCVVQTAPREFLAVFNTHTQAEYCAYESRKAQTVEAIMFMVKHLRGMEAALAEKYAFALADTAVLFAGDMNVDEAFCPTQRGVTFSELETMMGVLHHPHDLHRLHVGADSPILTFPLENSRLDYIFSWNVCCPARGGPVEPRSPAAPRAACRHPPALTSPTLHRTHPRHLNTAYALYALAAGASMVALVPATVIAGLGALIQFPAPKVARPCLDHAETRLYHTGKALLEEGTAAVCLLDCKTVEGLWVAPGHAASDHHPILLIFEVHPTGRCRRCCGSSAPARSPTCSA